MHTVYLPSVFSAPAQMKEGEVVLVHAGGSGVGTAAVQLVRLFRGVPVVTAGSPEKLKLAEKLGAVVGFNYKEESFAQGVHDFTGGELWKTTCSSFCCRRQCSVSADNCLCCALFLHTSDCYQMFCLCFTGVILELNVSNHCSNQVLMLHSSSIAF